MSKVKPEDSNFAGQTLATAKLQSWYEPNYCNFDLKQFIKFVAKLTNIYTNII